MGMGHDHVLDRLAEHPVGPVEQTPRLLAGSSPCRSTTTFHRWSSSSPLAAILVPSRFVVNVTCSHTPGASLRTARSSPNSVGSAERLGRWLGERRAEDPAGEKPGRRRTAVAARCPDRRRVSIIRDSLVQRSVPPHPFARRSKARSSNENSCITRFSPVAFRSIRGRPVPISKSSRPGRAESNRSEPLFPAVRTCRADTPRPAPGRSSAVRGGASGSSPAASRATPSSVLSRCTRSSTGRPSRDASPRPQRRLPGQAAGEQESSGRGFGSKSLEDLARRGTSSPSTTIRR